jgi:hypothetical protein
MTMARQLKGRPLYDALSKCGRALYPLNASRIETQQAICNCKAVLTRAGTDASNAHRARTAIETIEDAVRSIKDMRHRQIGIAIFGLEHFQGQLVMERKHQLYKENNISTNEFDKHRADVIAEVMHYLNSPHYHGSEGPVRLRPTSKTPQHVELSTYLAEAAASLHYSALASLFLVRNVSEFDELDQFVVTVEVVRAVEELFFSFLELAIRPMRFSMLAQRTNYWKASQGYSIRRSLKQALNSSILRDHFPLTVRNELVQLFCSLISNASPFTQKEIAEITVSRSFDDTMSRPEVGAKLQLQFQKWTAWHFDQLDAILHDKRKITERTPVALEVMAAKAGRIVQMVGRYIEFDRPIESEARWITRKNLSVWFRQPEGDIDMEGSAFGYRVEQLFENASRTLAENEIVWFDSCK